MTASKSTTRNYWLALSSLFGVTVSVVAMTDPPWSVAMVAAFVLFVVLQSIHYRQVGRNIQGKLATANPGVGILGAVFGGAAVLIHGNPVALWAGPALGLVTFLGMFLFLQRFGRFHHSPNTNSI
ncbi:hypothetical protein M8J71_02945 [Pseudarthrobacter sp. R1]|uniref:hypothetical protein n=1 Tax=Pseudarthrobacter sp. R1 TaxID=2944934 RepID=UPI00210A88EB|nr:hypothetical protein [Pseudarthrobacter sp. R1]MCQ6269448.1 hypothetical protein [Pseudarthrobacter sp. R1]